MPSTLRAVLSCLTLATLCVLSGSGVRGCCSVSGLAFAGSLQACCFNGLLRITLSSYCLSPLPRPLSFQFSRFLLGCNLGGFLSGDSRHVANACEVLSTLDKASVASSMNAILQNAACNDFSRDGETFQGLDDVLNWCANNRDDWLKSCGIRAMEPGKTYA